MSDETRIAELEAELAAARRAAVSPAPEFATPPEATTPPAVTDTSQMPGGVDSAPVQNIAHAAEEEVVDILGELKGGSSISDVASKLLDQNGLKSVVRAIGDLAGKIGL